MGVNPGKLPMLVSGTSVSIADGGGATMIGTLMPIVPTAWVEVAA